MDTRLRLAQTEVSILEEALIDVVNQACLMRDETTLDSMALTAYAGAMRLLAQRGKLTIEQEFGKRVIGHWVIEGVENETARAS